MDGDCKPIIWELSFGKWLFTQEYDWTNRKGTNYSLRRTCSCSNMLVESNIRGVLRVFNQPQTPISSQPEAAASSQYVIS